MAVIGGGMAGILTAWQLEQAGVRTVVLEADQIGQGQTKNTTAKITVQHGLFCHTFLEKKGEETARNYVQANQEAVKEYKRIIKEEGINCDLTEADSFVYSSDREKLRQETKAAQRLGIRADLKEQIEIPVPCAGAVCFPNRQEFHPLKFPLCTGRYTESVRRLSGKRSGRPSGENLPWERESRLHRFCCTFSIH